MKIAVISDTHYPYEDEIKISNCISVISNVLKPDVIVQIGDLYDLISFSKYSKDPSKVSYSPEHECQLGRDKAAAMWAKLRKHNPKAKLYQLAGNHDVRLARKMADKFPEAAFIAEDWTKRQMTFDGVTTVDDEFIIDDIMFMHGMRKAGEHARYNQMNTVTGHTHKGRVEYFTNRHGTYWEMNTGWLGDKSSYPFSYRLQKVIDDTQSGFGFIEHRQPRFIML